MEGEGRRREGDGEGEGEGDGCRRARGEPHWGWSTRLQGLPVGNSHLH